MIKVHWPIENLWWLKSAKLRTTCRKSSILQRVPWTSWHPVDLVLHVIFFRVLKQTVWLSPKLRWNPLISVEILSETATVVRYSYCISLLIVSSSAVARSRFGGRVSAELPTDVANAKGGPAEWPGRRAAKDAVELRRNRGVVPHGGLTGYDSCPWTALLGSISLEVSPWVSQVSQKSDAWYEGEA